MIPTDPVSLVLHALAGLGIGYLVTWLMSQRHRRVLTLKPLTPEQWEDFLSRPAVQEALKRHARRQLIEVLRRRASS